MLSCALLSFFFGSLTYIHLMMFVFFFFFFVCFSIYFWFFFCLFIYCFLLVFLFLVMSFGLCFSFWIWRARGKLFCNCYTLNCYNVCDARTGTCRYNTLTLSRKKQWTPGCSWCGPDFNFGFGFGLLTLAKCLSGWLPHGTMPRNCDNVRILNEKHFLANWSD